MTEKELLLLKLALLADWQYSCHDDFDEDEDMNEDQYWEHLGEASEEHLLELKEDDFDEERTPEYILEIYCTYLSEKYRVMAEPLLKPKR